MEEDNRTLNELWRDVTGLVWNIDSMIDNHQITKESVLWHIPDGAMLSQIKTKKAKDTKKLIEMLQSKFEEEIELTDKFSQADIDYNAEDSSEDLGS